MICIAPKESCGDKTVAWLCGFMCQKVRIHYSAGSFYSPDPMFTPGAVRESKRLIVTHFPVKLFAVGSVSWLVWTPGNCMVMNNDAVRL